ncbi:hypothetical protein EHO59_17535 [Leptospira semungkisensis]|uniref:Uncharacterized protein n=1 Tax=Leptospira semungkisensis TaxID=2484985 RepID=A0A4R9FLU5_9LEPT|nr:hypothetical protein [Leptospira semungkisensis]TGJ99641.1 hypothetical protein EHO59_17535 [Leptospira semungkisensis]
MKGICAVLTNCLIFQSLVFGSGWFSGLLAGEIKLCECNHASRTEKHASEEDSKFKSKLASADDHKDHDHHSKSLPDCHSAKSGETHKCACKKAKDKFALFTGTICAQFYSSYEKGSSLLPIALHSDLLSWIPRDLGIELTSDLEKPPRFS